MDTAVKPPQPQTSDAMQELRTIKDRLSIARLSRTPEEERAHMEKVMDKAKSALGDQIQMVAGK